MEGEDEISEGYESSYDGGGDFRHSTMRDTAQGHAQQEPEMGAPTTLNELIDIYWHGVDEAFETMNQNMVRHDEKRGALLNKLKDATALIEHEQTDADRRKGNLFERLRELKVMLDNVMHAIQDSTMSFASDDGDKDEEV